jgi:chemotaxis signal transduction protein
MWRTIYICEQQYSGLWELQKNTSSVIKQEKSCLIISNNVFLPSASIKYDMENQNLANRPPVRVHLARVIKIRGIVIIVVALAFSVYFQTTTLAFRPEPNVTVLSMLGYLLLVSLFVERAIEIILSSWRSAEADKLDREIDKEKKEIRAAQPKENQDLPLTSPDLEELLDTRAIYRAESRFAALWIGMCIGVIVSLAGVRILGNLFETDRLTEFQTGLFIVVDVLLTGFVLAGGSDAINKIYKVYSSFMSRVEQRNRQV